MANRRQLPIDEIPLPIYGLNDKYSPYAIHDREAAQMENVVIGDNIMQTRKGFSANGTTSGAGPIQNGYDYRQSDGTNIEVRARQDQIEELTGGAWSAITLAVSLTANLKVSFVTLNDLLLIANGTDNDQTWSGSGSTVARASNPLAKYMIQYQNRVVKLTDNGVLWFSDINDPTTFDALSFINIDPNNAAMAKGLGEHNGQVIAFKQNKAYTITALVGGSVIPLPGDISTVSHWSIASTGQSLIFLGPNGWYELRGTIIRPISGRIDMTKLSQGNLSIAHAEFFDDKYRCFVTENGASYNNLEYVFYTALRTPFVDQPYPVTLNRGINGLCYYKTLRNDQEKLYFGDSRPSSGSPTVNYSGVFQMETGFDDDGENIPNPFWIGKLFDQNSPFFSKKFKKMYTRIVNQSGLAYYVGYRFSTTDSWNDTQLVIPETILSWIMDAGADITTWSEGLDWPFEGSEDAFTTIHNSGRPRTIQFRDRIDPGTLQGQWVKKAYRYRVKTKFK